MLTSRRLQDRWDAPNCVAFQRGEAGLDRECVAQAETIAQLLVEDMDIENGWIGTLSEAKLDALVAAVGYVIGAECKRT